jgi:hypothetical protein
VARNARFIPPYWIDLCNQGLPSCLEDHAHRRVSRSFKRLHCVLFGFVLID